MRFAFVLALLPLTACASVMQPRVNDDLGFGEAVLHGATVDASRGYPIAFYANPGQDPAYVELDHGIGTTKLAGALWVTELARQMDNALAKVSLYDLRFMPISQQVFAFEVQDGDVTYPWREPPEGLQTGTGRVRIARLRLDTFKTASTGEGVHVIASVELKLGDFRKVYTCERAGERWDKAVFACLGETILGDPELWKAAAALP